MSEKMYGANFHGKRSLTENLTETLVRKYQIRTIILQFKHLIIAQKFNILFLILLPPTPPLL